MSKRLGGPFPIFLPSAPHWCEPLPLLSSPPLTCLEDSGRAHQHCRTPWGARGQKTGQGSSRRAPLKGSPSHYPRRPCQIRQQRRSRLSRGAGPFLRQEPPEEPFPRRAAAGPLRQRPLPPAEGRKRAPAPRGCCSRGRGTHPAAGPGPVSRRGGGGNRASRDRPGAGTSGTAGAHPPQRRPQVRAGLGGSGGSATWGSVALGSRAWWRGWWR